MREKGSFTLVGAGLMGELLFFMAELKRRMAKLRLPAPYRLAGVQLYIGFNSSFPPTAPQEFSTNTRGKSLGGRWMPISWVTCAVAMLSCSFSLTSESLFAPESRDALFLVPCGAGAQRL
jgi:hypothetical protein